jgi:hypothetical protein
MGFGSYDESERQNQEIDGEVESEAVNVHEVEHEGELTFENGGTTDELLDTLSEIKSDEE